MTTKIDNQEAEAIINAFNRSQEYSEIVHVSTDASEQDILDLLRKETTFWEGLEMNTAETPETLEIWGWDDKTPAGEMAFRIHCERISGK